jgi:hypothetical protein
VTQAEVIAVVFRFYGQDPIDMSWGRTIDLYQRMLAVESAFRPKAPIEMALDQAEDQAMAMAAEQEQRKRDAQWQTSAK